MMCPTQFYRSYEYEAKVDHGRLLHFLKNQGVHLLIIVSSTLKVNFLV